MYKVKPILESKSSVKGVLSTRTCPLMDIEKYNENGRFYVRKIFTDRILTKEIKEKMAKKCLLGEINHPNDRFESNTKEVAISMINMWIDEENQKLMGTFDVLDTPMGQIVETMLEYGCHIGISARALGKGKKTRQGEEIIPESYIFKTFDIVVDPGFFDSRVNPENKELSEAITTITESFDTEVYSELKPILESLGCVYNDTQDDEGTVGTNNSDEGSKNAGGIANPTSDDTTEDSKTQSGKVEELKEQVLNLEYEKMELEVNCECLQTQLDIAKAKVLTESFKTSINCLGENLQHDNTLKALQESEKALANRDLKYKEESVNYKDANKVLADKVKAYENQNKILKEALQNMSESITTYKKALVNVSESLVSALNENELEEGIETEEFINESKQVNKQDALQIVRVLNENKGSEKSVDEQTLRILNRINN